MVVSQVILKHSSISRLFTGDNESTDDIENCIKEIKIWRSAVMAAVYNDLSLDEQNAETNDNKDLKIGISKKRFPTLEVTN